MGAACHAKDPTKNKKELLDESEPVTRPSIIMNNTILFNKNKNRG